MLLEDFPDEVYGTEPGDRYPGPLAEPDRVTLWRHTPSRREYLAIAFNTGARVVLSVSAANTLRRILESWRSPIYSWPRGFEAAGETMIDFEREIEPEAGDELPF